MQYSTTKSECARVSARKNPATRAGCKGIAQRAKSTVLYTFVQSRVYEMGEKTRRTANQQKKNCKHREGRAHISRPYTLRAVTSVHIFRARFGFITQSYTREPGEGYNYDRIRCEATTFGCAQPYNCTNIRIQRRPYKYTPNTYAAVLWAHNGCIHAHTHNQSHTSTMARVCVVQSVLLRSV